MKKILYFPLMILLLEISINFSAMGQDNLKRFTGLNASVSSPKEETVKEKKKIWQEVIEKRSIYSSEWQSPNGNVISEFSELPVNYYHGGTLIPVVTEPSLNNNRLEAFQQPIQVAVENNGNICINHGNENEFQIGKNTCINGKPVRTSHFQLNGENAELPNIISGFNKTFHFSYAGVKYNYEIINSSSLSNGNLVIEEEISLPAGAKLIHDELHGENSVSGWKGALLIVNKNGLEIGKIRAAICFDQQKKFIVGTYAYATKNGKIKLSITVPSTWIKDPSRSFPVVVDPLVTGPTTTYTGANIQSCLAPANKSDSILVTIPAQVTVTDLFVSGSYYADPFTTCVMADGRMWFSTNCDSSQVFTITGSLGNSPGTAYLTNYDLRYPLLCCYPQSCNSQTFYLSMHLQRMQPGTGCNAIYLYHDPLGGYPFKAYAEGHTVEYTGVAWTINPNTLCSNVCNFNGTVSIKYGVPPYTVTHPWMNGSLTWQTPAGCSYGTSSKVLNLILPNCP